MRKCAAIVIMICLTASLLMSCGGSGGGDKNEGAQSKAEVLTLTVQAQTRQVQALRQSDTVQESVQQQEGVRSKTKAAAAEAQADQKPEKQAAGELPSQTDGYIILNYS